MGKLEGKVALITGAGSGIGRATALLFAKEGAKIVVADSAPIGGQETVRLIRENEGASIFVEADVSRASDAQQMVSMALNVYGRLDILHNNAGIVGRASSTAKTTEEEWDLVLDTNLKGVFLGSKYAIPVMLNQGSGNIINTASITGLTAAPGLAAYCASKGGVIQLTKTMALEYARHNIRVNCICPGAIRTRTPEPSEIDTRALEAFVQTTPLRRMGQPDEIAHAVLYLASDDSSFVTGMTLVIDGGATAGTQMASLRAN